jgi:predicted ArsR family transcriptional regulator
MRDRCGASARRDWRSLDEFITLYSMKTNQLANPSQRPGYGPLPTAQLSRRRSHLSTARGAMLNVLINQPQPCTVAALSGLIRQHPNTIREHLDGLSSQGLVVRTRAAGQRRGRPAWLYKAAPEVGVDPGAREYAALALALAAHIARISAQPGMDAIEAGRSWGRELVRESQISQSQASGRGAPPSAVAARREVVTILDGLGFAPSADARVGVVKLRRCPLIEAAHRNQQVVCSVHLGLVRGVLDELGADADRTERTALQPFSEPGACRLDLIPRTKSAR